MERFNRDDEGVEGTSPSFRVNGCHAHFNYSSSTVRIPQYGSLKKAVSRYKAVALLSIAHHHHRLTGVRLLDI